MLFQSYLKHTVRNRDRKYKFVSIVTIRCYPRKYIITYLHTEKFGSYEPKEQIVLFKIQRVDNKMYVYQGNQ